MSYKTLPIILSNTKILLIGGGKVALQKAQVMQRNEIDFEVISTEFIGGFETIQAEKRQKNFSLEDIGTFFIIIDATGSKAVMQMLLEHKQTQNFLYNCVDVPEVCDFFFAALLEYGSLKIAVSSSGASPTLAKVIRNKIQNIIPPNIAKLNQELQEKRRQGIINIQETKEALSKLLEG